MRLRRPVLLSLVAVLAVVATGCIPSAPPPGFPSGCGKPATPMVAQPRYLISGGVVRSYLLTVPDGYNPRHPYALILNWHGHGSNAIQQSAYTQMDAKARLRGFIVATPDGTAALHFDHSSLLATIVRRFLAQNPPAMGARYAAAEDLSSALAPTPRPTTGRLRR